MRTKFVFKVALRGISWADSEVGGGGGIQIQIPLSKSSKKKYRVS